MDKTQKNLQELGLTPNEALVYLASLELGPATAQQLAGKAAVVRPTAYVAIGGLVKRGLMSQFKKGKKMYFQGEKPDRLARLLEIEKRDLSEREAKLKEVMPMLASLVGLSSDKPEVKYYEGLEGLETMRDILIHSGAKTVDAVTTQQFVETTPDETADAHAQRLNKAGMKIRQIILTEEKGRATIKEMRGKTHLTLRYVTVPDSKDFGEVTLFKDYIALIAYLEKPYGFMLKSKQISNTAKILFESYWKFSG